MPVAVAVAVTFFFFLMSKNKTLLKLSNIDLYYFKHSAPGYNVSQHNSMPINTLHQFVNYFWDNIFVDFQKILMFLQNFYMFMKM